MAELVTKTRRRRGDVDADDAAYGLTALSAELLRAAGKVTGRIPGNPVAVVMAYCGGQSLTSVDDLRDHYAAAADQVRDTICDAEMAFSSLAQLLCRVAALREFIPPLNSQLFEPVPDASLDGSLPNQRSLQTKSHAELLELLGKVCEQYKAEEKDRNSSEYEKAFEVLEEARQLSSDVKAQYSARGKLYEDEGVLASCVNVKTFNDDVLGTSFDKTLHLPAGALDLSAEGYTPHLAAETGAASRLALSKIGDAGLSDANFEMLWFCYCWMSMALLESYYIAKCCYLVFGSYLQGPLVKGELGAVFAAIALGSQFVTMNKEELAAFKAEVEGEKKIWLEVGELGRFTKLQVFEFVSDKGDTIVCVKKDPGEGSSVAEWRASSFLGGQQLDPDGTVPVVSIDGNTTDHAFVDVLIKYSSRKLAAVEALPIVCVRSGLNDLASSFHYLSASDPSQALRDIVTLVRTEAFVSARTRSRALYAPPTPAQHASTVKMLKGHVEIGSEALVHQR